MSKGGRKGRISNELVAASCAAVLTVYASGYWRTRDEARRLGSEAQTRRPVQPQPAAPVELPAIEPEPVVRRSLQVVTMPPPSLPPAAAEPAKPVVTALASVPVEQVSAPEPAAEIAADEAEPPLPSHKPWKDGYFTGWGTSPHGDIKAFVTIEDGRIINAGIDTCETRYPCSVINYILLQPIDLQGPDVDRVSRASESGDAYYYGLVKALENAETGTFRSTRP